MKKGNVVGENVRKLRLKEGLTQEGLALKSGLSQGYINQLENGRRNYTQKTLEVIAEALTMPVMVLFEDDKKKQGAIGLMPDALGKREKRSGYKKALNTLLKGLPDHVIEHYVTLMKLEKELLQKKGK